MERYFYKRVAKMCLVIFVFGGQFTANAQVTFTKDVSKIIYNKCTSCHRPGEIAPFSLTNYNEVKGRASTIKYVTGSKYMPPWKADPTYQHYLSENYLTEPEIKTIADWVDAGVPYGNMLEEPPLPIFSEGSALGQPDMVVSFAKTHVHKGNRKDEYRYFVIPTGLQEDKILKAIEMRAGNKKIVHHALFFEDTEGRARQFDQKTPEFGFEGVSGFTNEEVILYNQFPGYAPGQKPLFFPDGMGQKLSKGSDLVVQIHYAPTSVDESDSTSINLFFADEKEEKVDRFVDDYVMLPFHLTTGAWSFVIYPGTVRTFEGRMTLPEDRSIMGIFPHMHMLGKKWEVWLKRPDGTTENLIKINDWDFSWQSNYYFKKFMIAPKGSIIYAKATYDNTTNNPLNPSNPPKTVAWGENTTDEMFYLPILSVPYKAGDESVVFEDKTITSTTETINDAKFVLAPNPVTSGSLVNITFSLDQGQPVDILVFDALGQMVRTLRKGSFFSRGDHAVHLSTNNLSKGIYFVKLVTGANQISKPLILIE